MVFFSKRFLLITQILLIGAMSGPTHAQTASDAMHLRKVRTWFDARIDGTDRHGQYMRQMCKKTEGRIPGWRDFPVERCDYTHAINGIEVSTTGYFLFPTGEMLSKWVLNACKDAKQTDLALCTGRLTAKIWSASNAQFAVAGYVVEPAQEKKWTRSDEPFCYLFRDGVTIATRLPVIMADPFLGLV